MVTVVTVTVWAKKIKLFLLFRKYYKLPLSTSLNVRIRKRFIELLLVNHIFTTTHGKSVTSGLPVRSLRTLSTKPNGLPQLHLIILLFSLSKYA